MAVEAENTCFESMGFGPYAMFSMQDCFMGSVLGIEGRFCFQEQNPFVDFSNNLAASSSSSASFSCSASLPVEIVQSLYSELEKQRMEMDWFLQLENKRLRKSILQEEMRRQAVILQKYESRIKALMQQKDEELAMARNKLTELQHFLKGAEMEAKAWEKAAKEKEAIVSDLNSRLNQAIERESLFPKPAQADDAVSFCDSSSKVGERKEDGSSSSGNKKRGCKLCQFRSSCVVFFPCKHLCCCKHCEPLLGHCPVCETVKEASLEVFLA